VLLAVHHQGRQLQLAAVGPLVADAIEIEDEPPVVLEAKAAADAGIFGAARAVVVAPPTIS